MPYPSEHMVFAWGGDFGTNNVAVEHFSGSMRFANTAAPGSGIDAVDNDAAMMQLTTKLMTFWRDSRTQIPAHATLRWTKWNRVNTEGKYVNKYGSRRYDVLEATTGPNTNVYPYQIALAVTWLTDRHRGAGSKGRTYFPTAAPLASGTGRISGATAGAMATACAELIANWSNWTGLDTTGFAPVVGSLVGAGALRPIQQVGVGMTLDTQRRRRSDNPETPQRALVPNA